MKHQLDSCSESNRYERPPIRIWPWLLNGFYPFAPPFSWNASHMAPCPLPHIPCFEAKIRSTLRPSPFIRLSVARFFPVPSCRSLRILNVSWCSGVLWPSCTLTHLHSFRASSAIVFSTSPCWRCSHLQDVGQVQVEQGLRHCSRCLHFNHRLLHSRSFCESSTLYTTVE